MSEKGWRIISIKINYPKIELKPSDLDEIISQIRESPLKTRLIGFKNNDRAICRMCEEEFENYPNSDDVCRNCDD